MYSTLKRQAMIDTPEQDPRFANPPTQLKYTVWMLHLKTSSSATHLRKCSPIDIGQKSHPSHYEMKYHVLIEQVTKVLIKWRKFIYSAALKMLWASRDLDITTS